MPKLSMKSLTACFCGAYPTGKTPTRQPPTRRVSAATNSPLRISLFEFSNSPTLSPIDLSTSLGSSNLHVFSLEELRTVTRDFSTSNFLGKGGFGPVYKGFVGDNLRPGLRPQPVAVKLLDLEGPQGHNEWLAEVIFLGQLRHPNLVKLIGYCYENEHRLLVYEYMSRGSLENHLFKKVITSLPWLTRLKIAVGAAKGLAFLHQADNPVIYRDFKASNILLDADNEAKLSDFGLAKDGPQGDDTHITTRVMGTKGYAAPEYIMTGHLTAKSDVYSFGVVLLELLSGRNAVDKNRPSREKNLVEWAKPYLSNPQKLEHIIDTRLEGQYSTRGAQMVALIASQCLSQNPKSRPDMKTIVESLEPSLEMRNIPIGPFVYTVMADEEISQRKDVVEEDRKNEKGKQHGQRHKVILAQPLTHSDVELCKAYRRNRKQRLTPYEK